MFRCISFIIFDRLQFNILIHEPHRQPALPYLCILIISFGALFFMTFADETLQFTGASQKS